MSASIRTHGWLVAALVCGVLAAAPRAAHAGKRHHYVGVHPIAAKSGGGFCYIEGPHVHVYAPEHKATLYRDYDGASFFIGDPVAYGYDGPKHAYYGHHPVSVGVVAGAHYDPDDVEYCYLDGPHYHGWEPASELKFEVKGGAYWYVDAYPAEYRREKPTRARINEVYAGFTYEHPVVIVSPPAAYVGPIVGVEATVAAPVVRADVHADVVVPAPVVEVDLGFPWVVVDGHHHHHHRDVVVVDDHHHHSKFKHKTYRRGGWYASDRRRRSGKRFRR